MWTAQERVKGQGRAEAGVERRVVEERQVDCLSDWRELLANHRYHE